MDLEYGERYGAFRQAGRPFLEEHKDSRPAPAGRSGSFA